MNTSDIITIVGVIIGLVASYLLGRRGWQKPEIRYVIDFDIILNPDDRLLDQNLQMTVGSHHIKSISRTRLALWNQRGVTVHGTDIVKSDPIRLEFADGDTPLQTRTLSSSREQIEPTSSINSECPTSVDIAFDFLDARDGAIFEIVHQGTEQPELAGTLRGATIRRHPASDLNPSELAAFSRRPRFRRIPKGVPGLTGFIIGAILTGYIAIFLAFFYHYPAAYLVNARNFNLNSMRGQANFANAVFNSNNPYASSDAQGLLTLIMAALCGIFVVATIDALRTFNRRRIPYGIAKAASMNRQV